MVHSIFDPYMSFLHSYHSKGVCADM